MVKKRKLTDKQERFCKEYIVDFNATQAAKRAKYKGNNHDIIGNQQLGKALVQQRIQQLTKKTEKKLEISAERTLQEMANLAYSNFYEILDKISKKEKLTEWEQKVISERTVTKSAAGGSIKYKAHSKEKGLEMLGRYFTMFKDKLEIEGRMTFMDWVSKNHNK